MGTQAARRRAEALRLRYDFAAEVLTLYLALLDVWETGATPELVVKAVESAGPPALADAARAIAAEGRLATVCEQWRAGQDLPPVERFFARACLRYVGEGEPSDERHCPHCGGPPQLSIREAGGDPLVSGQRRLLCARCGHCWNYSSSACASCGESTGAKRTVYAEAHDGPVVERTDEAERLFPHLRIDACATCSRYLIDIDLGRDAQAVPEVDELAALPLDLYAAEHGLTKITPNLMGF